MNPTIQTPPPDTADLRSATLRYLGGLDDRPIPTAVRMATYRFDFQAGEPCHRLDIELESVDDIAAWAGAERDAGYPFEDIKSVISDAGWLHAHSTFVSNAADTWHGWHQVWLSCAVRIPSTPDLSTVAAEA